MQKVGFDSEKFIELQKKAILDRIKKFDGKLYMELGGKIFDDLHASRVLPGYNSDNKIKVLQSLKDNLEIIICISARDIEKNKVRADFGITYDLEVLRLIDSLKGIGLSINSVCITLFNNQPGAVKFANILERRGEKVYYHYPIEGYPENIDTIVSDNGYGKNDYIHTSKPLVVVSAPGPGSCKMATCLSQLYHEHKRGIRSGYAKFETFPVHNLALDHPANIAYESATADLKDENIVDTFHLEAYNKIAVNYNRDMQAFPVLRDILTRITGKSIYKSPTDMGINEIAKCIIDEDIIKYACEQEVIRRYLKAKVEYKKGLTNKTTIKTTREVMQRMRLTLDNRKVCTFAHQIQMEKDCPIVAIELSNGDMVYGKDQGLITATAGAVLNALKKLAGIPHDNIVNREAVKSISNLKLSMGLGSSLDLKDIFIALSILSESDKATKLSLEQIKNLVGAEVHSTTILPSADEDFLRKLKVNVTCDDVFSNNNLFD